VVDGLGGTSGLAEGTSVAEASARAEGTHVIVSIAAAKVEASIKDRKAVFDDFETFLADSKSVVE
jgi:hypothetical protein